MICYICEKQDWHKMPKRNPSRELLICKECGNVAFEVDSKEEDKVREYYRNDYRGMITEDNLLTTNRKLQYIRIFLKDWLIEREKEKKQLIVGDVGCAIGFVPNWLKSRGHKATGSEWTPMMRRFAQHYYGLMITEELEIKHKYDLITIYHVLEHVVEPDKKLKHYASLLADNGRILVSTPEWYDVLENSSGRTIGHFNEYFHKDHINCFSRQSILNLFNKCGLEIAEVEDSNTHGQTFLLKKGKTSGKIVKEDWQLKVKQTENIYVAIQLWEQKKYEEAIKVWPKFPECYVNWIYNTSIKKDIARSKEIILKGLDLMPENSHLNTTIATIHYQNNEFKQALERFTFLAAKKPNENIFMYKGWCDFQTGNFLEAIKDFENSVAINPMKWEEANRWITKICSQMPGWEDDAKKQILDTVMKSGKVRIEPHDPQFETNGKEDMKEEKKDKVK